MYKLKNNYIDKMVAQSISSKEIDFILYIALFQDDTGNVESVYYKDVCEAISISYQKFYDILRSLSDKRLIRYQKIHHSDISVRLLNNDFSDKQQYKEGYLKVAESDFLCSKFRELKAGSKLLYLYMQRFINGKHMLVQNFYDEFCERFNVARKSMQEYIRELKKNSYLFISKKRNRAYNFEMTIRISTVLKRQLYRKNYIPLTEKDYYYKNIHNLIKRNFSRYIPKFGSEKILKDITMLFESQRARDNKVFVKRVYEAIEASIKQQKAEGKKEPVLNAALVNSHLTRELQFQF